MNLQIRTLKQELNWAEENFDILDKNLDYLEGIRKSIRVLEQLEEYY